MLAGHAADAVYLITTRFTAQAYVNGCVVYLMPFGQVT